MEADWRKENISKDCVAPLSQLAKVDVAHQSHSFLYAGRDPPRERLTQNAQHPPFRGSQTRFDGREPLLRPAYNQRCDMFGRTEQLRRVIKIAGLVVRQQSGRGKAP
jgi:hypothetical protein